MDNNINNTDPNLIPTPPTPPYNPYDNNLQTRKTLFLISFILNVILAVFFGIYGLISILTYATLSAKSTDNELVRSISLFIYLIGGIIMLVMLVWLIIAAVLNYKFYKQIGTEKEQRHLAFSICVLIFGNLISGILLIVASTMTPEKPRRN